MALIDEVKTVCDRLGPLGWRKLFLDITEGKLDILQPSAEKLQSALTANLASIDRSKPGFDDFNRLGAQGITLGQPSQSLLYHAFASSRVHPTSTSAIAESADDYPTLAELDVIENYIYSLVADRDDLDDTFVAVLAYQYREASRTPHLRHADMAYSRTGVARVGTAGPRYDPSRRSFWIVSANSSQGPAVLPARYGVFLVRRAKPGAAGSVQGGHLDARDDDFFFPLHKVFEGSECLKGRDVALKFLEFHRNEKLRMLHRLPVAEGGIAAPQGFDISKPPYVRNSTNGGDLVSLQRAGASCLVVPTPRPMLVRTASQMNSVSNTEQIVYFTVPETRVVRERETRFTESTLEIPAFGADRLAPEYVNIRHKVDPAGSPQQKPVDLNELPPEKFDALMKEGGYHAAHFIDDTCDGCVEAVVSGLPSEGDSEPAFSLVTAPDFFPLADQVEVQIDKTIRQVDPLYKNRLPVNPSLPRPSNLTSMAFNRSDKTVTAVVGAFSTGPQVNVAGNANRMISYLPDSASNIFAPGWDTSRSKDFLGSFLTSSGLGSPFPEDAKLCAALSSFWPAVAPDASRTFGNEGYLLNQLPMLDEELGFHPKHELVQAGKRESTRGWDGEFGPFFEKVNGKTYVNYVDINRSDYVSHTLAGRLRVTLTAEVQSKDIIARHQALNACQNILGPRNQSLCLVVVQRINDWSKAGRGTKELSGEGFLLEFAELTGSRESTDELSRVRREVKHRHVFQTGVNGVAHKMDDEKAFTFYRL